MSSASHKIFRLVFEIELLGRNRAAIVQDRISAFSCARLYTVLTESLSPLPGDQQHLVFPKVELDAGQISFHHLEEDLAAATARCLRDWVLRAVPVRDAIDHLERSQGFLPNRGKRLSSISSGGLNAAVASALRGPGDRSQLTAAVRENHAFRSRLASEVSPELLRGFLESLAPQDGKAIAEVASLLISLHDVSPLASANHHAFQRVLWECILTETAGYQSASFSLSAFISRIIGLLADRFSLRRSVFSSRIVVALQKDHRRTFSSGAIQVLPALTAVASSLTAQAFMSLEGLTAAPPESASQKISPEHSSWSGMALTHFMEWGTLPDSALRTASYSAASEILTGLAARPDEVCGTVRRLGQEQTVRRRIAGQFPETAIHRLIDSLDPVNASWMILVIQLLRRLHAERQLVPLQNQAFARLLWEFALEYLSVHHWHALDAASFMRFLLQKLAARQKTSYEFLLAGVALRRSWNPQKARAKKDTGSQSLVSSAILTLLEKDIFGTRLSDAPRFVVRPAFQHLYSDLDVLAYWLRWRRLPSWSFAATPEEMARHIGPLLRELPPEVRSLQGNTRPAAHSNIQSPETNISATSAAVQIEHWLLFGLWPAGAAIPQNAALSDWLERQDDSAWLCALRRCGEYKEAAIRRIITRLSLLFQLRIMELLTGAGAKLVCAFVQSLQGLEKQITVSSAASWKEQISFCVLRHILRDDSTGNARIFSVEMLAHATLRVISLRCQLSYEQLLQALRKKDLDSQTLQDLYRNLEIKLEDLSTKAELASLESRLPAVALEGAEILLHYMESGSLPPDGPAVSFHELQCIADHLNHDQLHMISCRALASLVRAPEIADRIAMLLSSAAFVRFMACTHPHFQVIEELEHALVAIAPPLSQGPPLLLTVARTFLLQEVAQRGANISNKTLVLRLLLHLAEYSGQTVLRLAELLQSAAGCSGLAGAITELQRERRMLSGGSDTTGQKNRPAALHSYQPQDELPSAQGKSREGLRRLNGLAYFLRNGEIPWWCRDLVSEPVGLLIKSLLQTNSGLLLNILQSAAVSSRAVDRLIQYVPQQSLSTIIQQAKPDYGGLLILYIEAGTGMAENKSLSPVQRSRLGGLHWRETLRFALEEDSAGRTPAQALRLLCSRVSQQLGLTTDKYVRSLLKSAVCGVSSQSGHAALAEILSQKQNRELSLNDIPQNTAVPESLRIEQPAEPAPEASKTTDTVRTERLSGKPSAVLPVSSRVKMHPHLPQKKHEPLRFPNPTNQAGQLEHLLRYGMLLETLSPTTLSQFMENLALDLSSHPELYRDYLRVAINHDLERKRMARLFSPQALNALLQILLPSDHAQASLCLQQLHAAAVQCSTPGTREELSLTCVEELLQTANRLRGNRWSMVAYARCATRRLKEDHSLRVSVLAEKLRERLSSQPGNIQQQFSQALDQIEREMAVIPIDPQTPAVQPEPEQCSEAPIEEHSTKFPADQPVYISNAGAVLLWPFLGRYFQTLGLLEKNAFRSESEKNRAIHLLQYLATGKLETPEHELLLNKVLCGSLPEQPLDPVLPLTEAEEALSTQLLQGVIANWEKLRNTSVEGLRASFIVREGRLLRKDSDNSWSLTVSTRGYDVLLDSLPWRISTIRLPWMQAVLHVKWR